MKGQRARGGLSDPCWCPALLGSGRCSSGGGGQSAVGAVLQMMEAGSHPASVQ